MDIIGRFRGIRLNENEEYEPKNFIRAGELLNENWTIWKDEPIEF